MNVQRAREWDREIEKWKKNSGEARLLCAKTYVLFLHFKAPMFHILFFFSEIVRHVFLQLIIFSRASSKCHIQYAAER